MDRFSVTFKSGRDTIAGVMVCPDAARPSPALLLCHGALDFKENFAEMQSYLASRGIASLAVDMRGHGASSGPRWHVDMDAWVEDIRRGLDFLQAHPAVRSNSLGAFGFSSGGTAVLEAALVEDRLGCIITLDATVDDILGPLEGVAFFVLCALGRLKLYLTGDEFRLDMSSQFRKVPSARDPDVNRRWQEDERVRRMWSQVPFPGIIAAFKADTLRRAGSIRVPVLLIHGEGDEVDPPETAFRLFEELKCPKRLCIVPGNGHMGHLDANRKQVFELTASWATHHLV